MALMNFLHRPEPKRFEYKPRFYDASKDKDEQGNVPTETEQFARRLHNSWDSKRTARNEKRQSNSKRSVIWIIFILLLLLFIIFKL